MRLSVTATPDTRTVSTAAQVGARFAGAGFFRISRLAWREEDGPGFRWGRVLSFRVWRGGERADQGLELVWWEFASLEQGSFAFGVDGKGERWEGDEEMRE